VEPRDIGVRIRRAREARQLSQEQLAEMISRTQHSVSEYESGKRRIYAHDLPNIARALNVPVMYFFEDALTEADLDATLLEEYHRLDEAGRKLALEMIRLFAQYLSR
jgi:transcriptional regulator with XRE-family HTH domain